MERVVSPYRFFQFSNAGNTPDGTPRWMATAHLQGFRWWDLCYGRPINGWDPTRSAVVYCTTPGPPEDMPWVGLSPPIVSDRLRRLLKKHAPNCAQFLRVQMKYEGSSLDLPPYWAANWLQVADCIDWDQSLYKDDPLKPGEIDFWMNVIDPAKIPCRLLRVRHCEVIALIREDLRTVLEDQGITGCRFYDIWHSGDELPHLEFDPKAFHSLSDRFTDKSDPKTRIDHVHEFVKTMYMRGATHFRGSLPPSLLQRLILDLGNRVGVDRRGEGGERLCNLFLNSSPQTTGTYTVYVEIESKRKPAVFHFCIENANTISFGFWGDAAFIALLEMLIKPLRDDQP